MSMELEPELELNDMASEGQPKGKRCSRVVCCVVLVLLSVLSIGVLVATPMVYTHVLQPMVTSTVDKVDMNHLRASQC